MSMMKNIFLLVSIMTPNLVFARSQVTVRSPMAYAEAMSKDYALGDTYNSSGWRGCISARNYQIVCEGTMEVLVRGGHRSSKAFICEYQFRPLRSGKIFLVERAECT